MGTRGTAGLQRRSRSVADDGPRPLPPSAHRRDDRGALTAFELEDLPFPVRRVFVVSEVPTGTRRGGHRHHRGDQALFCTSGQVEVELRTTDDRHLVVLEPGGPGVVIPADVWSTQTYVAEGSTLLVLCSEPYDPGSYDTEPAAPPATGPEHG